MIEKAVAAKPDSGAIVDSLGWADYKLGLYTDAVEQLERATELEPAEPDINDHLGDAYWAVGRKLEARFQWEQVLSLGPSDKLRRQVEAKLRAGPDAGPRPVIAEQ
jgi:Flp pilus assembly protein TadD